MEFIIRFAVMMYAFQVPTTEEFDRIVIKNISLKDGGLDDIKIFYPASVRGRRGGGTFSILSGLAKRVAPFMLKTIAPEAIHFGRNLLCGVMRGENVKKTLKQRGLQALRGVGERVLRGGRRKKRLHRRSTQRKEGRG